MFFLGVSTDVVFWNLKVYPDLNIVSLKIKLILIEVIGQIWNMDMIKMWELCTTYKQYFRTLGNCQHWHFTPWAILFLAVLKTCRYLIQCIPIFKRIGAIFWSIWSNSPIMVDLLTWAILISSLYLFGKSSDTFSLYSHIRQSDICRISVSNNEVIIIRFALESK